MGPSTPSTNTNTSPSTSTSAAGGGGGGGAGASSVSEEYRNLVDKAFSKFTRLREFPQFGRSKWDTYYHKAFQVYSKLWKFQQENREELMRTNLKRWEIGEIAYRIGQLYYNYYQRTSDAKFLSESWIFYDAIMTREYFKDIGKDPSLVNKHLRFYARFIVVCFLLNKREMVRQLVVQLRNLMQEYTLPGNDGNEWRQLVKEITRFMDADACCESGRPLRYSISLDPHPLDLPEVTLRDGSKPLRLQDAILASYYHNEVKVYELTLDSFRMLQSLEWEPTGMLYRPKSTDSFSNGTAGALSGHSALHKGNLHLQIPDPSLPANPHKYILYRPTVSTLLLAFATACDELSSDSILLLYISAAGSSFAGRPPRSSQTGSISASSASGSEVNLLSPTESLQRSGKHSAEFSQGNSAQGQNGALSGSSSQTGSRQNSGNYVLESHSSGGLWLGSKRSAGVNYLFPSDILPFTRRPLLIVIDSDNSSAFEVISGHERGEPAALLLSPTLQVVEEKGPSGSSSSSHSGGNLFTFFLTAPVPAFCRVVGVSSTGQPLKLQPGILDKLEKIVAVLSLDFGESLAASPSIDSTWGRILNDPFLRQMVFRFVLCRAIFSLHTLYHSRQEYIPRCLPRLPEEASPTNRIVEHGVFQLASQLGVADQFIFSPSIHSPSRSNGELKWKGKSPTRSEVQVSEGNPPGGEKSVSSELTD